MEIKKKINELEIHYLYKVVKLRGHQDDDVFTVFEEDWASKTFLTKYEKKTIEEEFEKRGDIIIR
jgi:hypothetical protein